MKEIGEVKQRQHRTEQVVERWTELNDTERVRETKQYKDIINSHSNQRPMIYIIN